MWRSITTRGFPAALVLSVTAALAWAQDTTVAIQRLALTDPGLRDLGFKDLSLALVGDPTSREFGVAVDGTAVPKVYLTGNEKLVIRLYTGCGSTDGKTNVATVELTTLPKDTTKPVKLIATKEAKAFVPMKNINCAVLDME